MPNPKNTDTPSAVVDQVPGDYGPFKYIEVAVTKEFDHDYDVQAGHIFLALEDEEGEAKEDLYVHVTSARQLYVSRTELSLAKNGEAAISFTDLGDMVEWDFRWLPSTEWEHWDGATTRSKGWPSGYVGGCPRINDDTEEEIT